MHNNKSEIIFLYFSCYVYTYDASTSTLVSKTADESESGIGLCGWILTVISWVMVMVTLPFSLCVCFKVTNRKYCVAVGYVHYTYNIVYSNRYSIILIQVVQEYERAVIFRLGRLLKGGSRGPGNNCNLECSPIHYDKIL